MQPAFGERNDVIDVIRAAEPRGQAIGQRICSRDLGFIPIRGQSSQLHRATAVVIRGKLIEVVLTIRFLCALPRFGVRSVPDRSGGRVAGAANPVGLSLVTLTSSLPASTHQRIFDISPFRFPNEKGPTDEQDRQGLFLETNKLFRLCARFKHRPDPRLALAGTVMMYLVSDA